MRVRTIVLLIHMLVDVLIFPSACVHMWVCACASDVLVWGYIDLWAKNALTQLTALKLFMFDGGVRYCNHFGIIIDEWAILRWESCDMADLCKGLGRNSPDLLLIHLHPILLNNSCSFGSSTRSRSMLSIISKQISLKSKHCSVWLCQRHLMKIQRWCQVFMFSRTLTRKFIFVAHRKQLVCVPCICIRVCVCVRLFV